MGDDIDWREFNIHDDGDEGEEQDTDVALQLFAPKEEPYETYEYRYPSLAQTIRLRGLDEHSSTGLAMWLGSEVLSRYLADHPALVRGKRVFELGAGMGLCGLVAHHLGASEVLLTDGDIKVLKNLRYNVEQNACSKMTVSEHGKPTISCPQLIWGRDLDAFTQCHGQASVIIASGVVYMTKSLEPLWQTIDRLMEKNGLFLYVGRNASQAPVDMVLETATRFGFVWTTIAEDFYLFRRKMDLPC